MMLGAWVLAAILGLPLLGAVVILLLPRDEPALARGFGLGIAVAEFALSLAIFAYFDSTGQFAGGYQLVLDKEWIPGLGAHFKLGVDGISLWLVLLTTFTMPIVLLSAQRAIDKHVREFVVAMLVLEAGMLGAFLALDLFLFYICWEVMLIPMYLLIGIWGGHRRLYASIKFVVYTMVGSLLMLAAILFVYAKYGAQTGAYTTDLDRLLSVDLTRTEQIWCFLAFALAFAIKVPLFPLHTWLPDAHVEAPTAGSVVLAGVLLKFGIYGFIRFAMPLFPVGAAVAAPYIAVLSVIGIIYGALVAFAQDDVKKLVAYSSVSHLGFCALGVFSLTTQGIEGSIFAMLSHGLTTGGLFLAIGVLYERRHTRRLAEYGGLWKQMPVFAGLFLIVTLGSAGLPGLSGFVGEFLTILGTFVAADAFPQAWPAFLPAPRLLAALAATGVILGAVYLLYMFQKVMFGPLDNEANKKLPDVSGREIAVFVPIVVMIFVMGLFPRPFLKVTEPAVARFQQIYERRLNKSLEPPAQAAPAEHASGAEAAPAGREADEAARAEPAAGTPEERIQRELERLGREADRAAAALEGLAGQPGVAQPGAGQPGAAGQGGTR